MKWRDVLELKEKVDKSNFMDEYLKWGSWLNRAYKSSPTHRGDISKVVIVGMGGSGITGDIIKYYLEYEYDIDIHVYKDWRIPRHKLQGSILIAISFSGNTIETIKALEESLNHIDLNTVYIVTTDGTLEKMGLEKGLKTVKIDRALAPRAGLAQLVGSTIKILRDVVGETLDNEVARISSALENDAKRYYIDNKDNRAFNIAFHIWGRYPIFYGTSRSYPVLARAKAMVNENAKLSGYYQVYPEGYHNEIEIFDEQIDPVLLPLIIRWDDEEDIFRPLKEFLEEKEIEYYEIPVQGKSYLEYVLRAILLLDMASIYLAYLTRRDPLPTKAINNVKGRMRIE